MKLNILKKGFSLTELLIVLVVVAVLFSAMLPIMTKRDFGATKDFEPVWRFVGDVEQNAYTNYGNNNVNNALFIGNTKPRMSNDWKPYSKLVIKTDNETQNMLQLRYGQGNGILAALFHIDNRYNILTAGRHQFVSDTSHSASKYNTIYGNGLFATVQQSLSNTFIGSNSTKYGSRTTSSVSPYNVSVGVNTNRYGKSLNSVLLGANIASEDDVNINNSVVLGANNLVANSSIKEGVLIGNESVVEGTYGYGNTIIGSRYKGGTDQVGYNTLVGVGAFERDDDDDNKAQGITSVGYNTCNTLAAPNGGAQNKTCIGYTSGSGYGNTQNMNWESDGAEHIFIGGVPQHSQLGGRAVLEVHNITKDNLEKGGNLHPGGAKPDIAPTVVMNSNLVVRGNTYLTTIDGVLRPMNLAMPPQEGVEHGVDYCSTSKWRDEEKRSVNIENDEEVLGGFKDYTQLFMGGAPDFIKWAKVLGYNIRSTSELERVRDAKTGSAVMYDLEQKCVYNGKQNYPYNGDDGNDSYGKYCPFLHLSDVRLKTDISENTAGIEKLLMVMPYNYTYKADKASKPQVGVIAQDLQKYFPNSVSADEDGYLSIRWDDMFFATINSVKSLDETLALAEKDVADMENDVIKLANNHRSTKKRIDELNKRINKLEK